MPKEFKFPDVGEGITEGELVRWLVHQGDRVQEDQPLVEVETDKAIVTIPSPYSGTILQCHGQEGDIVQVGDVLVTLIEQGETEKVASRSTKDAGTVVGKLEEAPEEEDPPTVRAIPSVRALAKKLHVDINRIRGTGPEGRILREDVEQAAGKTQTSLSQKPLTHEQKVERIPLRGIRRASARHVSEAARRAAHVTFMEDADITELEKVRAKEKPRVEKLGYKLTYVPFLIKAVIAGLEVHPYLNALLDEERDEIILRKYYNIGIAIDTLDGLMVFVLKRADDKSILDLAKEMGDLIPKAQTRSIHLDYLKGSTFTITNYGVIGGSYGTPLLNYPEVGILGMGRVQEKPVVRNGQIVIRRIMPLSLSFDHRVIDGAEAARFLNVVIQHLEDPHLMLLKAR